MRRLRSTLARLTASSMKAWWLPALVLALLLTALPLRAAEVRVDAAAARALQFHSLTEFQALTGLDSTRVIALFVSRADGWEVYSRSGADYSTAPQSGAPGLRGGPFGGGHFARDYDGVSDWDSVNVAVKDSFSTAADTMMLVLIFRSKTDTANNNRLLSNWEYGTGGYHIIGNGADGRFRIDIVYPGGAHSYYSTVDIRDKAWHVARILLCADTLSIKVDDETPYENSYDGHVLTSPRRLFIAAEAGGGFSLASDIALVLYYADTPSDAERDTLYNLLKPHLDGSGPFAAVQPALDYLGAAGDGDGVPDTVTIAAGIYPAPVVVEVDSVLLRGRVARQGSWSASMTGFPVLDGVGLAGFSGLSASGVRPLEVRDLGLTGWEKYGVNLAGVTLRAERLLVAGSGGANLHISGGLSSDSVTLDHLTLDDSPYGILAEAPDTTAITLANSIIAGAPDHGILHGGTGKFTVHHALFWDNGTDWQGITPGEGILRTNPLFVRREAGDRRLAATSPARFASETAGPLGAFGVAGRPGERWGRPPWQRGRFIPRWSIAGTGD